MCTVEPTSKGEPSQVLEQKKDFTVDVFHPALHRDAVRVRFKHEYCAKIHPDKVLNENIQKEWLRRKEANPTLFDGSKFRFHSFDKSDREGKLVVNLGLTSYGDFLGTNHGPNAQRLLEDGLQSSQNLPQTYFADPLGVGVYLTSSDGYIVCIERSGVVGEFAGYIDAPGGHPEPSHVWDPRYKSDAGRFLDKNFFLGSDNDTPLVDFHVLDAKQCVDLEDRIGIELFNSIIEEIVDEINIPKSSLESTSVDTGLIAVIRQTVAYGRPSLLFKIKCTMTKEEIDARYRLGAKEAFETVRLHFLPAEVVQPTNAHKIIGGEYTPACLGMFAAVKEFQRQSAESSKSSV